MANIKFRVKSDYGYFNKERQTYIRESSGGTAICSNWCFINDNFPYQKDDDNYYSLNYIGSEFYYNYTSDFIYDSLTTIVFGIGLPEITTSTRLNVYYDENDLTKYTFKDYSSSFDYKEETFNLPYINGKIKMEFVGDETLFGRFYNNFYFKIETDEYDFTEELNNIELNLNNSSSITLDNTLYTTNIGSTEVNYENYLILKNQEFKDVEVLLDYAHSNSLTIEVVITSNDNAGDTIAGIPNYEQRTYNLNTLSTSQITGIYSYIKINYYRSNMELYI